MLSLPRHLRLLFAAVGALLLVNAAVLASRLAEDMATDPLADAASGAPATDETVVRQVVVITAADGSRIVVDPSTPEGQALIAEAEARGDDIDRTTVAVTEDGTVRPAPGRRGGRGGDRTDDALLEAIGAGDLKLVGAADGGRGTLLTLPPVGDDVAVPEVPGAGPVLSTVSSVVNQVVGTANSALNQVTGTANSVVQDATGTVNSVLQRVTETVNDVVQDVTQGTTVSVPGVPVTVSTPPVTTPPVTVTTPPVSVPGVPVTVPPVTVTVTVPPVTVPPVTVPPVTLPPVTVPTTVPCLIFC